MTPPQKITLLKGSILTLCASLWTFLSPMLLNALTFSIRNTQAMDNKCCACAFSVTVALFGLKKAHYK